VINDGNQSYFQDWWLLYQHRPMFGFGFRFMVFNATFNTISVVSWRSVLLMEESRENHRPVASHWQNLSHNVVSSIQHYVINFVSDLRQVGGFLCFPPSITRDTTLCDKFCQWLATGRWFSLLSSINNTDRHDTTEIVLKVALNTINLNPKPNIGRCWYNNHQSWKYDRFPSPRHEWGSNL
jgi:hypothetical protein